ncbi:MAG: UDP-N-acetylmuramoyl-L-alanyl-D-glutamate--2,6-diaminopimelate ligase [Vulcanimicrobiaceae bacterium]
MMYSPARPTTLAALIAEAGLAHVALPRDVPVVAISHDSRTVTAGTLFVALRGERADGQDFVATALAAGASAVVVDAAYASAATLPPAAPIVVVDDTYRALSALAAALYAHPSRALRVAGVTGTNGKTTVTHLVAAMLGEANVAAGRIGTLGARFGGAMWSLENTTPLALELQALLAEMLARGARAVAMEASSHALAQGRVADVAFAVAALTNVTRDHLDYHGTFDAYAAAKRTLFDRAPVAVLNADDACGRAWATELRALGKTVVSYALDGGASPGDRAGHEPAPTLVARDVALRADGSSFTCDGTPVTLRLPGRFNVSNALAALGIARTYGVPDDVSARALAAFDRVPGRMEHLAGAGVDVIVDYAHTPDALDVVLATARETARGRLAVVFGCGGDRDRGKRPLMGRIARARADRLVVTSDNPRGEEPQAILEDILSGIDDRRDVTALVDRRAAIRRAILESEPGDVVVVAGKGHETYQIVGTVVNHFDDRDEVRAALAEREMES